MRQPLISSLSAMFPCQAVGEILMYLVMMGEGRSFFTTVPESVLARKYCQTIKQLVTLIRDNKLTMGEDKLRVVIINLKLMKLKSEKNSTT